MDCTLDFETRSHIDIKEQGGYVYTSSKYTEPVCLSVQVNDDAPKFWVPEYIRKFINPANINYYELQLEEVQSLLKKADKIIAHNSSFEYLLWNFRMVAMFGCKPLKLTQMHDTMAMCATYALPLSLEYASLALNLSTQKDMVGHNVMKKVSRPRYPRKAEREADPDWMGKTYWNEKQADLERTIEYCCTDVETERLVYKALTPLSEHERKIWLLNEKINLAGVPIDVKNVTSIVEGVRTQEAQQRAKFDKITAAHPFKDGKVLSGPLYHIGVREWVNEQTGLKLNSVDKDSTKKLLARDGTPKHVKKALRIRAELSKSSVSKLSSMLNRMNEDERVRGWSIYHAASTGRWAAWGLQLHNLPRDSYKPDDYASVAELFKDDNIESLKCFWDDPYYCAGRCVRGSIKASPGKEFICTDFSAIEGRGLAYLAGEQWVLDAYANGEDMYKYAAADLFGIKYEEVIKDQRQIGKVEELFLGYAGGIGAFASGAKSYSIDLEKLPALILPSATTEELVGPYGARSLAKMYVKKNGGMSLDAATSCDIIKRRWRVKRPKICALWKGLETAAMLAIENPGLVYPYLKIKYVYRNKFLRCQLPSGRVLYYFHPKIRLQETEWGEKKSLTYMGMKVIEGKTTRQWSRLFTFGGKLAENVTQAHCRDLLADAMLRHDAAGYKLVMHVHDEDMAEVDEGTGDLEEFNRIAEIVPPYAKGMPIKAEGWIGKRYKK